MNIQVLIHYSFLASALFYLASFAVAIAKHTGFAGWLWAAGMICHACSLVLRYWACFPLLPLYQGPFFLPFVVGIISFRPILPRSRQIASLVLINLLSWSAYFFPNDFYLPFLQFKTLFAHGFFLLGVLGRALFLVAGTGAVMLLMGKSGTDKARSIGRFVLWGFFFWTLSVFSGAVWSWLGWGSPIVWDDPVITTTMATWLLYSLMLHLHLTRFSSADSRAWFALAGAAWVFCFNCMPELGPFRPPGWFL